MTQKQPSRLPSQRQLGWPLNNLVLSIFPGIDLLGKGFELEGFCVVRGPDILWGGDIRDFFIPSGFLAGVIGGPPCQQWSGLNRNPDYEKGAEMLREYLRIVKAGQPDWFLLENVARVPDVQIDGYQIQRFDLNANQCGLAQSRLRHFQFGSKYGLVISPVRLPRTQSTEPICLASEGQNINRREWADFCELQGLPRDFTLDGWSIEMRYRMVGNGVPVPMAAAIARAIKQARPLGTGKRLCKCGCGRICQGGETMATAGCRKRMQRRRDMAEQNNTRVVTL